MTTYDPTAYRQYFEREFTYLAGFRRNTHRYADRVALRDPASGTSLTYRELGDRVDRLATGLVDAGTKPGDVVVYQLYNATGKKIHYRAAERAKAEYAEGLFEMPAVTTHEGRSRRTTATLRSPARGM